jgi:mRNA interferase HigB
MKVHLIKEKTLRDYATEQVGSAIYLTEWVNKIKAADWQRPADILKTFSMADLLGKSSSRVVFNIGGNNYRMICKYAFGNSQVHLFVCWIGTHAAYDKICKEGKQFSINVF